MTYYSPKYWREMAAIRRKHQAASVKPQAPEDTSNKLQAPSDKRQASSRKRQAAR